MPSKWQKANRHAFAYCPVWYLEPKWLRCLIAIAAVDIALRKPIIPLPTASQPRSTKTTKSLNLARFWGLPWYIFPGTFVKQKQSSASVKLVVDCDCFAKFTYCCCALVGCQFSLRVLVRRTQRKKRRRFLIETWKASAFQGVNLGICIRTLGE